MNNILLLPPPTHAALVRILKEYQHQIEYSRESIDVRLMEPNVPEYEEETLVRMHELLTEKLNAAVLLLHVVEKEPAEQIKINGTGVAS